MEKNEKDVEKGMEDDDLNRPQPRPQRDNKAQQTSRHDTSESEKRQQADQDEKEDGKEEKDPNVVDWDGPDDPTNPLNWSKKRKWGIAVCMGLMTLVVTFASSVFSSATMVTAMQFGVSSEVMILGLALFVLGFAFGK